MKFPRPFHKAFDQSAAMAGLNQRFEDIAGLPDPAERLVEYRKLGRESDALWSNVNDNGMAIRVPVALGSLGLFLGGMVVVNPFIIGAGAAIMFGGLIAGNSIGQDALDAAGELGHRTKTAIDNILKDPPMAVIAASPHFDQVMQDFPALKEKFLLAASRQKALETQPAPKPGNAPGFRL